jgi:hypothetical protein
MEAFPETFKPGVFYKNWSKGMDQKCQGFRKKIFDEMSASGKYYISVEVAHIDQVILDQVKAELESLGWYVAIGSYSYLCNEESRTMTMGINNASNSSSDWKKFY